jgi:hypothetical protein
MRDVGIIVFDHLIPKKYTEFLKQIKSSYLTQQKSSGQFHLASSEPLALTMIHRGEMEA